MAQDAFLRAYQSTQKFDESRPFRPWFMGIVTHLAVQTAQKQTCFTPLNDETADNPIVDLFNADGLSLEEQIEGSDFNFCSNGVACGGFQSVKKRAFLPISQHAILPFQDIIARNKIEALKIPDDRPSMQFTLISGGFMRYTFPLLILLALLLSACSAASTAVPPATPATPTEVMLVIPSATNTGTAPSAAILDSPATPSQTLPSPTSVDTGANQAAGQDLARTDEQGAVVVEVSPKNLSNPGATLDFEVALNTHSVNLSMDLAKLATIQTDTGLSANATAWDGMAGGHHVSGNLSFPAQVNGKSLLEGAKVLTLVIRNVDAPKRTFTWNLKP